VDDDEEISWRTTGRSRFAFDGRMSAVGFMGEKR
jgi:hypothetical protein